MTAVDFLLEKITLKKRETDIYLYPRVTNKDIEQAKEMEKQQIIDILDWLTNEKSKFSIMYGNQDKRFASNDKDYRIDEILEIYKETEQKTTEEIIGKKATDYCEKYKGTDKYNVAMLAIEFGYQLFETRHNYIKKHTYSKIEKL